MGVIKKNDTKVGLYVAKSEESLNIPQSDDETSSASTVTDGVPVLSIRTRRNIPCPLSFPNRRTHLGKKRNRRYENALQLETWREEDEFEEITIHDLIHNSNFGFAQLFENVENMESSPRIVARRFAFSNDPESYACGSFGSGGATQAHDCWIGNILREVHWFSRLGVGREAHNLTLEKIHCYKTRRKPRSFKGCRAMERELFKVWHTFITSTEETQKQIVEYRPKKNNFNQNKPNGLSSFQNIKFGLRNMLKKSHLPLGILNYLETDVVSCFVKDPQDVYVSGHVSSFERLLLHAVSQYHQLHSFSVNEDTTCMRVVKIYNPFHEFKLPEILLGKYLENKRT